MFDIGGAIFRKMVCVCVSVRPNNGKMADIKGRMEWKMENRSKNWKKNSIEKWNKHLPSKEFQIYFRMVKKIVDRKDIGQQYRILRLLRYTGMDLGK